MKARLYRGPADGKIIDVMPTERTIVIQSMADVSEWMQVGTLQTVTSNYNLTKHSHPDGSVYFEWDQPRGKRSGVKSRRRKKNNVPPAYMITVGNGTNTTGWTSTDYSTVTNLTVP